MGIFKRHRPDDFLVSYGVDGFSLGLDFKVTGANRAHIPALTAIQGVSVVATLQDVHAITAEGIYYIHSIENWDEIERGLRAVRAKKMLAASRMLWQLSRPVEWDAELPSELESIEPQDDPAE